MLRKILKYAGYSGLFVVCLAVFMVWTFPMGKVKAYLEVQARRGLGVELRIGDLQLSGLSGIEASDLLVKLRRKSADEKDPAEAEAAERTAPKGAPKAPKEKAAPKGPALEGAPEGAADAPRSPEKAAGGAAKGAVGGATGEKGPDKAGEKVAEGAPEASKLLQMRVQRLEAHVSLWQLLFGDGLDVSFEADLFGGHVRSGHVAYGPKAGDEGSERGKRVLSLSLPELENLDLRQAAVLESWLGLSLRGFLSGQFELQLELAPRGKKLAVDLYESRASAALRVSKARVQYLRMSPKRHSIELRDVNLGSVTLAGRLDKRAKIAELNPKTGDRSTVIHLSQVRFKGGDLIAELQDTANITIQKGKPFSAAYANLRLQFKFADAFQAYLDGDSEPTSAERIRRYVLGQSRDWKAAERNGFYGYQCVCPVRDMGTRCRPVPPFGQETPRARQARPGEPDPGDKSPAARGRAGAAGRERPGAAGQRPGAKAGAVGPRGAMSPEMQTPMSPASGGRPVGGTVPGNPVGRPHATYPQPARPAPVPVPEPPADETPPAAVPEAPMETGEAGVDPAAEAVPVEEGGEPPAETVVPEGGDGEEPPTEGGEGEGEGEGEGY